MFHASPYQKSSVDQKRMSFTRPKTRMLASTAPADRANNVIQGLTNASFHTPVAEQTHEFNPIRDGHQSYFFEEQESVGNSMPKHEATLQPTSKAFSISGMRHDTSSCADQHDHKQTTTHN